MNDDEDTALALRDAALLPDAYERKYMAGQGAILHREKRPAPRWMQALLGSTALFGLALLPTAAWAAGLLMVPTGLALWALFSVLRLTISEGAVHIQYGVFGPKIPIASILEAKAIKYQAMRFGGWGIKRSLGGEWIYNMPGDGGNAVRIVWRDAKGRERITNVGVPDPARAVAAIGLARRAIAAGHDPAALSAAED